MQNYSGRAVIPDLQYVEEVPFKTVCRFIKEILGPYEEANMIGFFGADCDAVYRYRSTDGWLYMNARIPENSTNKDVQYLTGYLVARGSVLIAIGG